MMFRQRTVRNSDFIEVNVVEGDVIHFRSAFIYGFKNIQNLVMKMKVGQIVESVIVYFHINNKLQTKQSIL